MREIFRFYWQNETLKDFCDSFTSSLTELPAVCELKCECFSCLMAYTCCCLSIPKIRFSFHLIGFPIFLFSKLGEAQAGKQQCLTVQSLFAKWKYYLVEEFWIRRCKDFLISKYWVSMLLFVRKETRFLFEKRWLHIFPLSHDIQSEDLSRDLFINWVPILKKIFYSSLQTRATQLHSYVNVRRKQHVVSSS